MFLMFVFVSLVFHVHYTVAHSVCRLLTRYCVKYNMEMFLPNA